MFQPLTITFLKKLKKNNNKVWFDEHKNDYLEAKKDHENFVSSIIEKIAIFDEELKDLQSKDCVFRINRDIRFSKDKTPYKTGIGASFNRQGKKSMYAGYYFHLEPGNKSFSGGGLWMPMAAELKKVRQEIDYNFDEFTNIIKHREFISHFNDIDNSDEVKLTNLPRGYEKTNPAADYLKFKSFVAIENINDTELLKSSLITKAVNCFKALNPFITFLNRALE